MDRASVILSILVILGINPGRMMHVDVIHPRLRSSNIQLFFRGSQSTYHRRLLLQVASFIQNPVINSQLETDSKQCGTFSRAMFKHAPWAHGEAKSSDKNASSKEEESLTSVLDAQQRSEFTLLIATAAASMRRTIELNFDASVSYRHNESHSEYS